MPAILLFWSRAERYAPTRAPTPAIPGSPALALAQPPDPRPLGTQQAGGCRLPGVSLAEGGMRELPGDVPVRLPGFGVGHPRRMLSVARE